MNQQNDKTEKIIKQLQLNKPQLLNPEMLTDSIMSVLPEKNKPDHVIIKWIRILSGVAAIFLLGLLFFQQNDDETLFSVKPSKLVQYEFNDEFYKSHYTQPGLSVVQKYRRYLSQNVIKNQKFRNLNKNLNKSSHENFD